MMSPEQLQQIIQVVVATMTTVNTAGDRGDRREGDRNILHEKMFRRMEVFADWKEWLFNFGIAMTSANVHVAKVMRYIELEAKIDVTVAMVRAAATQEGWSDEWATRAESDPFGLLCMLTKGDANTTVRSAEERNGFVAWAKPYQKHNPKTPARGHGAARCSAAADREGHPAVDEGVRGVGDEGDRPRARLPGEDR